VKHWSDWKHHGGSSDRGALALAIIAAAAGGLILWGRIRDDLDGEKELQAITF